MQFKIPQDVEAADKIIGFLTFKQLGILAGGGAIIYIIYISSVGNIDPTLYVVPIALVSVLTVLAAFFRMENITFAKLMLLILEGLINPSTRTFRPYTSETSPLNKIEAQLSLHKGTKARVITTKTPKEAAQNIDTLIGDIEHKHNTLN